MDIQGYHVGNPLLDGELEQMRKSNYSTTIKRELVDEVEKLLSSEAVDYFSQETILCVVALRRALYNEFLSDCDRIEEELKKQ